MPHEAIPVFKQRIVKCNCDIFFLSLTTRQGGPATRLGEGSSRSQAARYFAGTRACHSLERSKNHTRNVFYGNTKKCEKQLFSSFFSLMKRSKNQPTEHNLLKISH
jgi:hypothetical protein